MICFLNSRAAQYYENGLGTKKNKAKAALYYR